MGGHGDELLAGLATLGPYFTIETHDAGDPLAAPWRPLAELIGSPDALRARAGQVRAARPGPGRLSPDGVEPRVAASVAQLGLSARLIAPAFGLAVLAHRGLGFDAGQARWVPGDGSMFPLSLPAAAPDGGGLPRRTAPPPVNEGR